MTSAYTLHKRLIELTFEIVENDNLRRRLLEINRAAQIEYNETLREYEMARARQAGKMCLLCTRPPVKRGLCAEHAREVFKGE